jgi:hypothetical protein
LVVDVGGNGGVEGVEGLALSRGGFGGFLDGGVGLVVEGDGVSGEGGEVI